MLARFLFKTLDLLQGPLLLQWVMHLLTRVSRLTAEELDAARQVLGHDAVQWQSVRIAEGRLLRLVFKVNGDRAITLFRTINLPAKGHHSRGNLDLLVHEMVHVFQFEKIGSVYIWGAIQAQKSPEGYDYGGWENLTAKRESGKVFSSFNREQQGKIAEHFYERAVAPGSVANNPAQVALQPFIDDLQAGNL